MLENNDQIAIQSLTDTIHLSVCALRLLVCPAHALDIYISLSLSPSSAHHFIRAP